MGKERAGRVYIAVVALVLLTSTYLRVLLGPLLPIPNAVAWPAGGVLLLVGFTISHRWHRLKARIYAGELVTEGVYAHVRHPHYSSIILMVLGAALLLQSLPALLFAILNVAILYQAAKEEEEHLLETHGAAYEEYMKKVRWRFIPWVI